MCRGDAVQGRSILLAGGKLSHDRQKGNCDATAAGTSREGTTRRQSSRLPPSCSSSTTNAALLPHNTPYNTPYSVQHESRAVQEGAMVMQPSTFSVINHEKTVRLPPASVWRILTGTPHRSLAVALAHSSGSRAPRDASRARHAWFFSCLATNERRNTQ